VVTTSVSGNAEAQDSVSAFPRTAKTGGIAFSVSMIFRFTNIARMNDQFRSFESVQRLLSQ